MMHRKAVVAIWMAPRAFLKRLRIIVESARGERGNTVIREPYYAAIGNWLLKV